MLRARSRYFATSNGHLKLSAPRRGGFSYFCDSLGGLHIIEATLCAKYKEVSMAGGIWTAHPTGFGRARATPIHITQVTASDILIILFLPRLAVEAWHFPHLHNTPPTSIKHTSRGKQLPCRLQTYHPHDLSYQTS
jgi:hypothetical protein